MRQHHIQTNFSAGMLSPRMLGYEDTQAYQSGAKLLENFIVEPQGSITKRPGTYHAAEVKDSSKKPRLYPFNFGQGQAYVLEFGENYIRFYQNGGPILVDVNGGTCTADAGTDKISLTAHGLSNGDQVWFSSTGTLPAPLKASIRYYVVNKATNDFQVALTSGGSAIDLTTTGSGTHTCQKHLEVTTTYAESELPDLNFVQSADFLFIVHPDHQPATLQRTGSTSWTLADYDLIDGPYMDPNETAYTMTPVGGTTGNITIDLSNAAGVNGGAGFQSGDVGRHIRISNPTSGIEWGWAIITAINSTTNVDATVQSAFATTNASTNWQIGMFSDTTGWPRAVALYQQRLVFAGTDTEPQGVWASKSGVINTFSPTEFDGVDGPEVGGTPIIVDQVLDDNAVTVYISNDTVDQIEWLKDGKKLAIGTSGGIFVLYGSSDNLTLTPFNITIERSTDWAVESGIPPIRVGNSMLYAQKNGRKLREWSFVASADQYEAVDLTIRADTLTEGKIASLAFQDQPGSVVWCALADGGLRGLTYIKEIETFAWHKHTLGGSYSSGDPVVDSICVIPTGTYDQLWLAVKRTINGATVRHVEFLEQVYSAASTNQHYVDGGLAYSGASTTSITGLDHLEGETVAILADDAVQPQDDVSDGAVTLPSSATAAAIGLPYNADWQTLPLSTGELKTTMIGGRKKIDAVTLRLYASIGIKFGYSTSDMDEAIFRKTGDTTGAAVPLFTGDKELKMVKGNAEEETRGEFYFRAHQPTPVTILAMATTFDVNMR